MKHLRRAVAATVLGGAMLATTAFADQVTLNPSAPNTGATGGVALSADTAFTVDKATTSFASLLSISSTPGAGGVVGFVETGYFLINQWGSLANSTTGVNERYNVYATFTIAGGGIWASSGLYIPSTTGLTVSATVYGSPGATPVSVSTPTLLNPFGVTIDATDFVLGTASLINPSSAAGTAFLFGDGTATTNFTAPLKFAPATGTTGATGFWQAPVPFDVTLATSATGTGAPNGTIWSTNGTNNTSIVTQVTGLGVGSGSGNILFNNNVPEPGTLALAGLALVGFAASRRKAVRGT